MNATLSIRAKRRLHLHYEAARRVLEALEEAKEAIRALLALDADDVPSDPQMKSETDWTAVAEDARGVLFTVEVGHSIIDSEVPPFCWSRRHQEKLPVSACRNGTHHTHTQEYVP